MLGNYFLAALRGARRDWFYATLNVLGLALGFAVVILVGVYVRDELSFNSALSGYHDAYSVRLTIANTGQTAMTTTGTPAKLAAELKLDFPEILATARSRFGPATLKHGEFQASEEVTWVDADFLSVLGYPLLRGDATSALSEPDCAVITRSTAMKYFGSVDVIGQTLLIDAVHPVRVTAVAEDLPSNTSKKFSVLLSGKTAWGKIAAEDSEDAAHNAPGELAIYGDTFVRLRPGTDPSSWRARLAAFARAHYPDPDSQNALFASLYLHSMADVHLRPFNPDTNEPDDRVETVGAIAAIGVFILLLAGVNFVNLGTARATRRAVEVGVRKGAGATRGQLMVQFMSESVGYALVGLVIGAGLAYLALPRLGALLDRQMSFALVANPAPALAALVAAALVGILAGVYPALVLSSFPAARALKAGAGATGGGGRLRVALVVFQFSVTIALMIATLVIDRQMAFATSRALGFDKDLMLTLDLTGLPEESTPDGLGKRVAAPLEALRARLAGVAGVQAMAATFNLPMSSASISSDMTRPGRAEGKTVNVTFRPVDFGYFGMFRVPLLAGRDFARSFAEDSVPSDDKSRLSSAVINQTALRALGFSRPAEALGQEIKGGDGQLLRRYRIVGVAPDFPLDSVRDPVPPTLFMIDPDLFKVLALKLSGADLPGTLEKIDAVWREMAPQRQISRTFLDDRIAGLYLDVTRQSRVFEIFSGFAIAIGCLGLIGLSAYSAERRTKEIGVRKALGASTSDIFVLLIRQFLKPVLLANLLAWPAAWWFARTWLDGFAYRIDLGPAPFVTAALAALAIALATTAYHAMQASRSRPVVALRHE